MTKGMAAYGGQGLYRGWGPCRPWGGRQALFFCQGPRCEFEEKKLHLGPVALLGRPGDIFEIFQNGHIFLKFLFFKNIKKKKPRQRVLGVGPRAQCPKVKRLSPNLSLFCWPSPPGNELS